MSSHRDYAVPIPIPAIDSVVRIDDNRITTRKAISKNEPFFSGHYPKHPISSGVFIVETVYQTARHYAAAVHAKVARLAEIRSTRFRLPVVPGDVLESDCQCTITPDQRALDVKATCRTAKGEVADLELRFRLERMP